MHYWKALLKPFLRAKWPCFGFAPQKPGYKTCKLFFLSLPIHWFPVAFSLKCPIIISSYKLTHFAVGKVEEFYPDSARTMHPCILIQWTQRHWRPMTYRFYIYYRIFSLFLKIRNGIKPFLFGFLPPLKGPGVSSECASRTYPLFRWSIAGSEMALSSFISTANLQ